MREFIEKNITGGQRQQIKLKMVSNGIEKLKRVMHRLKEEHGNREYMTRLDVEKAIMMECGLDERTVRNKLKALKTFGWIRCIRKEYRINHEADYD